MNLKEKDLTEKLQKLIVGIDDYLFDFDNINSMYLTQNQLNDINSSKELITSGRDLLITILKSSKNNDKD